MARHDDDDMWLSEIDLRSVKSMLRDKGVTEAFYKVLPQNANSKNQVYLGGKDLSEFSKIPSGNITAHSSISEKSGKQEAIFQAPLELYWLDQNGEPHLAPEAKLIYYPQYPEVRFSGFLKGCKKSPSSLWSKEKRGSEPDRILVLGVGSGKKIFGITLPPESPGAKEIRANEPRDSHGVLNVLPLLDSDGRDDFLELMHELCRIHQLGWVPSERLDRHGILVPCNSSNCHGNTLESLLGIRSNGYSSPDFMGWEIKSRQVTNIERPRTSIVTLFTPEPTCGVYADVDFEEFMRRYGYPDTKGREDRLNIGGIYRANRPPHSRTNLRLMLDGFNAETGEFSPSGAVQLLDQKDNLAAAWPFAKLMDHWKAKHAHAAFVPAQQQTDPVRKYRFGKSILLGEGAKFGLLLNAIHEGKVYYDPGIKLENISSGKSKPKKRSQFRVNSRDIPALYISSRIVDVCEEAR